MHKVGKSSLTGCRVWTSLEPLLDVISKTLSVNNFPVVFISFSLVKNNVENIAQNCYFRV